MKEFKQKTTQNGLRVFLVTLLLLIGLVVINLLVALLPTSITEIDISSDKMYSVSDTTKRALSKLNNNIELYYLASGGEDALADEALHTKLFLSKIPDYNSHISFEVIDTATRPTFVASLGITDEVANNSIIVKSDKRTRVITQNDLFYYYIDGIGKMTAEEAQQYVYMVQLYYGQSITPTYHFDGEGQLLTAIDYVTTDTLPTAYILDGHSEVALSNTLVSELSLQNIDVATLTLMKTASIPEDCDLLIINCPQVDLTTDEAALIADHLAGGGKLMLITMPGISSFTNLLSIVGEYGLSMEDGILVEGNSNHYYQVPYYLFPSASASHAITAEYASSSYILLPSAHGIQIADTLPEGVRATGIFTTSESAYIVDLNAETIERPEGQETAAHHVGVVSEAANGSQLIWISSFGATDDNANSYTSGGNYMYLLSAVKWLCDTEGGISVISPLMLSTPHLTVPAASAGLWSIILIFLIPIAVLICGLVYWLKRRKR